MRLQKYQKEAIVRAVMADVPKPDKSKRKQIVQDAVVKAMSPECRKIFKRTPHALATHHVGDIIYDDMNWSSRTVVIGDAPSSVVTEALAKFKKEDEDIRAAREQLKSAVMACTTIKSFIKAFPEFEKYAPKDMSPVDRSLPVIANVVSDLAKLGWPKGDKRAAV